MLTYIIQNVKDGSVPLIFLGHPLAYMGYIMLGHNIPNMYELMNLGLLPKRAL